VTFDKSTTTLNETFRGDAIYPIAKPNGDIVIDSFGLQMELADEAGEIIIADMPPGIIDDDNPTLRALADSKLLEQFTSIGLIIPVSTHNDYLQGAFEALDAYAKIGLKHDRGLIRAYRPELASPTWESFPTYARLAAKFPVWECHPYMQCLSDMMQGRGPYADYPGLDKLPEFFIKNGATIGRREKARLTAAVSHLESARAAISEHLLKPIAEKPSKPAKSE
jgi:hypothetical protein